MSRILVQTRWLMLNTCSACGRLGFWYILDRGHAYYQPPIRTLDSQSLISSLRESWNACCCMLLHSVARGRVDSVSPVAAGAWNYAGGKVSHGTLHPTSHAPPLAHCTGVIGNEGESHSSVSYH